MEGIKLGEADPAMQQFNSEMYTICKFGYKVGDKKEEKGRERKGRGKKRKEDTVLK